MDGICGRLELEADVEMDAEGTWPLRPAVPSGSCLMSEGMAALEDAPLLASGVPLPLLLPGIEDGFPCPNMP